MHPALKSVYLLTADGSVIPLTAGAAGGPAARSSAADGDGPWASPPACQGAHASTAAAGDAAAAAGGCPRQQAGSGL